MAFGARQSDIGNPLDPFVIVRSGVGKQGERYSPLV